MRSTDAVAMRVEGERYRVDDAAGNKGNAGFYFSRFSDLSLWSHQLHARNSMYLARVGSCS
jgi:hypothetical protein